MKMRGTIFVVWLITWIETVPSAPPRPVHVFFSSLNLRNVLHWHAESGSPEDTNYTVQYAIYGDRMDRDGRRFVRWRAVPHCVGVRQSFCDLTNHTSDVEESYYARVRAIGPRGHSRWAESRRFDPATDTTFGSPRVTVEIEDTNNAIISLKGPMRWRLDEHTPEVSMATVNRHMRYSLLVHNPRSNLTHYFPLAVGQNQMRFQLMEFHSNYCFSATTILPGYPNHCMSSALICHTTPPDPMAGQLHIAVVGVVVPSLCVCVLAVAVYLLCHSVKGTGNKKPKSLEVMSLGTAPPTSTPEHVVLISPQPQPHPQPRPPLPDLLLPAPSQPYNRQCPAHMPPHSPTSVQYGFVARGIADNGKECRQMEGGSGGREAGGGYMLQATPTRPPTGAPTFTAQQRWAGGEGEQGEAWKGTETEREEGGACVLWDMQHRPDTPTQTTPTEDTPICGTHSQDTPTSDANQSDDFSDDYGIVVHHQAREEEGEEEDGEEEDSEEEQGNFINWNPETGILLFPDLERETETEQNSKDEHQSDFSLWGLKVDIN